MWGKLVITMLTVKPIHGLVICKFFREPDDLGLNGYGDGFHLGTSLQSVQQPHLKGQLFKH